MPQNPRFFDASDPDGPGLNPNRASTWLIDRIVDAVRKAPNWQSEDGQAFALAVVAHQTGKTAELSVETGEGTIRLTLRTEGGWLVAEIRIGTRILATARIDQPATDYEIWSSLEAAAPAGRIGSGLNWIVLDGVSWPGFSRLGQGGPIRLSPAPA